MTEGLPGYPGLTVERNVGLRLEDGVRLRADVYRPGGKGPWPVLLTRLPYDKTEAAANLGFAHPAWYASQGYIVVAQDVRGRFASEGQFYPLRHEAADGRESVEWAARLEGSSGRVGMYGFSYGGMTQLLAATLRPPSLACFCPGFAPSQFYDGCLYNQGALALAFAAGWSTLLAQETARREGDAAALADLQAGYRQAMSNFWTLPLRDFPPLQGGRAPFFADWLAHSSDDDYWAPWSIEADYGRLVAPGLHIGGWYDVFLSGTVRNFLGLRAGAGDEAARRSQKLLIGPWYHMPWHPLAGFGGDPFDGRTGANLVDDWQIRWFDHFLKGRENGVLDKPVTVYEMGRGWRDLDGWPPSQCRPQEFFLHSRGRANSALGDGWLSIEPPGEEPPDVFTYSPHLPVLSAGGHSCCRPFMAPMGPADQAPIEIGKTVLVYTSPPLEREMSLLGPVSLTLFAASDAPDTDFTARLCRVDPGGRSTNLQEGIVRARFRESLSRPSPITPGRVYEYRIDLGPVGVRLAAGQRLRLDVSSSDFPMWERNLNTGGRLGEEGPLAARTATQTVLHTPACPSRLSLPVCS